MPYEKLTKRDKNQLRFPFETVRIRLLWKQNLVPTPDNIIREISGDRGVYKEHISYTGGGAAVLAVSSFVLVSIAQFGRASDF